jgi:RNA polymerase sigma-70 factor (ECF subfamily)
MTAAPSQRRAEPGPVLGLCDGPELVAALGAGKPAAVAILFDRYAPRVQRILARVLGADSELADLLHEVFLRALESVGRIDEPGRIEAWLAGIAVHAAREAIRRRTRQRWLSRLGLGERHAPRRTPPAARPSRRPTPSSRRCPPTSGSPSRCVRGRHGADAGREACAVSLATIKRRLAKAERRFVALARRQPALEPWLAGGGRWSR